MSSSVGVNAVVGLRIPLKAFFRVIDERCCEHPVHRSKYCPECGKPMFRKAFRSTILRYYSKSDALGIPGLKTGVFEQLRDSEHTGDDSAGVTFASISDDTYLYFGYGARFETGLRTRHLMKKFTSEMMAELEAKLKAFFEPLGLWDEEAFGVHAFATY